MSKESKSLENNNWKSLAQHIVDRYFDKAEDLDRLFFEISAAKKPTTSDEQKAFLTAFFEILNNQFPSLAQKQSFLKDYPEFPGKIEVEFNGDHLITLNTERLLLVTVATAASADAGQAEALRVVQRFNLFAQMFPTWGERFHQNPSSSKESELPPGDEISRHAGAGAGAGVMSQEVASTEEPSSNQTEFSEEDEALSNCVYQALKTQAQSSASSTTPLLDSTIVDVGCLSVASEQLSSTQLICLLEIIQAQLEKLVNELEELCEKDASSMEKCLLNKAVARSAGCLLLSAFCTSLALLVYGLYGNVFVDPGNQAYLETGNAGLYTAGGAFFLMIVSGFIWGQMSDRKEGRARQARKNIVALAERAGKKLQLPTYLRLDDTQAIKLDALKAHLSWLINSLKDGSPRMSISEEIYDHERGGAFVKETIAQRARGVVGFFYNNQGPEGEILAVDRIATALPQAGSA